MSRLEVDLGRIRANVEALRARIAPAEYLFVVKDDAYGHGLERVVAAVRDAGISWFGAVDVPTALRARTAAGPQPRILAWSTTTAARVAEAIAADVDLGVGDADHLETVAAVSGDRRARVHLKIDTGLHRSGVRPEDWNRFVARAAELEASGAVDVVGVWSHIAETSDADDDASHAVFGEAVAAARAAGLRPDVQHLAASAAAYARPEFRHDLVRFGAFGYGIRSADGPDLHGIAPAATLLAPVVRLDDDVATIALGALDGLPSILAGRVAVGTPGGARMLRSVGPVESAVDAWPGASVGDEVAVFGPGALGESSATALAEAIDTVGEEILVRVSPLIPREFVG